MTDSYQGSLRLEGETKMVKKRHLGVLMIEDDGIVFLFENNDANMEIKFKDIKYISSLSFERPLIELKNGKSYIFSVNLGGNMNASGLLLAGHNTASLMSTLDHNKRIKQANQLVSKTLKYLIEKEKKKKVIRENE